LEQSPEGIERRRREGEGGREGKGGRGKEGGGRREGGERRRRGEGERGKNRKEEVGCKLTSMMIITGMLKAQMK